METKCKCSNTGNTEGYPKDTTGAFEKCDRINGQKSGTGVGNEHIIPANGHDICNYLTRYGISNFHIQAVLKLNGILNFDKLSRAVRLSIEAEPVFGCRFVEDNPPYWKRMENIDEIRFCSFEVTNYPDDAVRRFLESPLDMDNDPMVKISLIRSKQYDTLCIKFNHVCCDGAGVKEYIHLLSNIYSLLDRKNGAYKPAPRIGGRKDQDKLFSALGIKNPLLKWNPLSVTPVTAWPYKYNPSWTDTTEFAVCRLPHGQLAAMKRYGRAKGATINDLILTVYYRALFEMCKPLYGVPMDISSTIDLRRYLPGQRTEAIRNLSGVFCTRVSREKDEAFDETLSRITDITKKVKQSYPGLQNAISGEYAEKLNFPMLLSYCTGISKCAEAVSSVLDPFSSFLFPGLSNIGYISRHPIRFGDRAVIEAFIVPPVIRAPGIVLMVSTYKGLMTLSMGYYKDSFRSKDAEFLVNKVKEELANGCVL